MGLKKGDIVERVLILADFDKRGVAEAVQVIETRLRGRFTLARRDLTKNVEDERVKARFGLVLGGDGAILAAARRVGRAGVPLLGVNLGKLGFLAEIGPDELPATLDQLCDGAPEPVEYSILRAELVRNGKVIRRCVAVNDVVISRDSFSRVIELRLFIDGEQVNAFVADGIIFSTPVGSTAHNLAAGGPILTPDTAAIVISPICPHTLSNRPLVVSSDAAVEMEVWSTSTPFAMTADGQVLVPMQNGDRVRVRRNEWPLRLLKVSGRSFFQTLRTKLSWEGRVKHA